MADFDLSAIIRGDASSLVAAGRQAEGALEGLGREQTESAQSARQLADATAKVEQAERAAALAATKLGQAQEGARRSQQQQAQEAAAATREMNRQAFGARNLGQQFGDLGLSIAAGISPARAFAQQAGQMGYAASEMGGKIGAVGRFLTGPWGIALTIAAAVAGPFVEKLWEAGSAAKDQADKLDKAAQAADSYGSAQSLLGKIIDLTTGKLKTQNAVLIQTIKLQAQANILAAQAEQKTATKTLRNAAEPTTVESIGGAFSAIGRAFTSGQFSQKAGEDVRREREAQLAPLKGIVDEYAKLANTPGIAQGTLDKALDRTLAKLDALGKGGKLAGRDLITTKQQVLDLARTLNDQRANELVLKAINGEGIAPELVPYKRDPKPKKPKAPKVDRTTPAEIERIASISAEFDEAPALIDRAAKAMRDLDRIIADVSKRKPPNFKEIIADAERAKVVVQEGLNKPYKDFVETQINALATQRLINEGRADEADAIRIIRDLESKMGPLTDARKAAVLATVQAVKAEQRETDILREKQQKYLNSINDIRSAVRAVFTDGARGIADLPKRIVAAFTNLRADFIMEKLFGDAFRELQDRATGTTVIKDASAKMANALEGTLTPLTDLANAASSAAQSLGTVAPKSGGGTGTIGDDLAQGILDKLPDSLKRDFGIGEKDIEVKGRVTPEQAFGRQIATLLGGPEGKQGLISKQAAGVIGEKVGQAAGGAATGAMVNSFLKPLGKALGVKTSQTGAQIGGAIGSFLPIPGGDIIGSVIGSVVGGLFKKAKTGSATITNVTDDATLSGNSAKLRKNASALGGNVQAGIQTIADQLGGSLGAFSVSIGQRDGKFRVDPTGRGNTKTKRGAVDFGDDEAAATAYAIRNAITDGAVQGLSSAVQRALNSSSDIDKALREALKVQQVEELIGGIGSTMERAFRDFDKEAADRVRIAKQYGLDVVKIEQINGEQRAKLLDDTLKARVGSLKDFLDATKFGDLSEGTIADKRTALLAQRSSLEADAAAGKDGAADKLASISEQLLNLTREGFGTAGGEYASDRATSIGGVERVIQMETDRVNAAAAQQQATTTAIETNNTLTNETNQLLAVMNTNIGNLLGVAFGGGAIGGGKSFVTERATDFR